MKKGILIAAVVIIVLVIGIVALKVLPKEKLVNYGDKGEAEFSNLTSESGFGLDIDEGVFPLTVELEKGELNIKITNGNGVIFEQTNIAESQEIEVNIPENGYYIMLLSGKKAEGKIKYQVADSKNNPIIDGKELKPTSEEDVSIIKKVLEKQFKENYGDEVEEVKIVSSKVYSAEEIESMQELKDLNLKTGDLAFEVSYELKIKEGTEDMMKYTAASGEIEGQWIKEKSNVGVARYDSEKDEYTLSDFGTAF